MVFYMLGKLIDTENVFAHVFISDTFAIKWVFIECHHKMKFKTFPEYLLFLSIYAKTWGPFIKMYVYSHIVFRRVWFWRSKRFGQSLCEQSM